MKRAALRLNFLVQISEETFKIFGVEAGKMETLNKCGKYELVRNIGPTLDIYILIYRPYIASIIDCTTSHLFSCVKMSKVALNSKKMKDHFQRANKHNCKEWLKVTWTVLND